MKGGTNPERVRKVLRYLAHMYDKYVHGAYITAMELYDGRTWRFMVGGHESLEYRSECKRAAASKLHEALSSLHMVAIGMDILPLARTIEAAAKEIFDSGELS
jgi:hypothetical protein